MVIPYIFADMITKKQVEDLKPAPFVILVSYPRFKDGKIPVGAKPHAIKREWSFEGTHDYIHPDGTIEKRQGCYIPKMRRR